jgi:hypothetical protein
MPLTSLVSAAIYKKKHDEAVEETSKEEADEKLKGSFYTVVFISVLELALLVYAVYLAIKCNTDNRAVHLVVAVLFPFWYVLYAKVFQESTCRLNLFQTESEFET